MIMTKRKVFISHHKADKSEVDAFIDDFESVFTPKVLGANDNDDFIDSTNTDYVMQRIRKLYLEDSTVTIVLIGKCTHSRRYVDWEIKSSLTRGEYTPNGLMGIMLPNTDNEAYFPPRLHSNWELGHNNGFARCWSYPSTEQQLSDYIEDAYRARTERENLINNSQEMMKRNSKCKIHGKVH